MEVSRTSRLVALHTLFCNVFHEFSLLVFMNLFFCFFFFIILWKCFEYWNIYTIWKSASKKYSVTLWYYKLQDSNSGSSCGWHFFLGKCQEHQYQYPCILLLQWFPWIFSCCFFSWICLAIFQHKMVAIKRIQTKNFGI